MLLKGKLIAVLVEDLYQGQEVWYPYYRLTEEGAKVVVVGTSRREYKSKHGYPIRVDKKAGEVAAGDFDALIVPGGYAPGILRRDPAVIRLVLPDHRHFLARAITQ